MPKTKSLLAVLLGGILWTGLVLLVFEQGWLHRGYAAPGDVERFVERLKTEIAETHTGALTVVVLEQGQVVFEQSTVRGAPIAESPVYQMASVSKWVTAWGVLALVQQGRIDLDAPIADYVTRWTLPEGPYDTSRVTVRGLLSHSAGLGDGLGYSGLERRADLQTLEASLDAPNGVGPPVSLAGEPGTQWRYSGGGYTLLQLMIEEVSGQSFPDFMRAAVFAPMGLARATFDRDAVDPDTLAVNFDVDMTIVPYAHYTALAAASWYADARDAAAFLAAHRTGGGVLNPETLVAMRRPHIETPALHQWGLGPAVYVVDARGEARIIGHDGGNRPAIRHALRVDPVRGDGIVVMGTGPGDLAPRLSSEWVFWKTGRVTENMFLVYVPLLATVMGFGWVLLALAGLWAVRRSRR